MNHTGQSQLLVYMSRPLTKLTNKELDNYLWLVELQLQEVRQVALGRRPPWELDKPNT